ncbi:carbon monoxide dehydrogenase subunit G [Xanthobacter autotrophicus DSM 431]|uniref:SRPBCC family protein n=1 Tax=Xanthobacter nonsaccharivorans TaxID=3119912 RepID=UPI00372973E0
MDITGEYRIPARQEAVWAALNDPDVLRRALPGCQTLEQTGAQEFTATVTAKVGPVSATFKGKVELSDLDPPHGYTLSGRGQGGPAGFAKGSARVRLVADGGDTVLTYSAEVDVGGKLAAVGGRLIGGVAKTMADQFFGAFSRIVAGEAAGGPAEAESPAAPAAARAIPVHPAVPPAAPATAAPAATAYGLLDRFAWLVAGAGIGTVATLLHLGRF